MTVKHSVFADLAERAGKAGADGVQFEVNLQRFLAGPQPGTGQERSWWARAFQSRAPDKNQSPEDVIMLTRFGRTGEEAFRNLVQDLEREKRQ